MTDGPPNWPQVPLEAPLSPPASSLPSQLASMMALVTALGGVVAAWRGYEGGQDTQRAAYDAVRTRIEVQARQIEDLARQQDETRDWMAELSRRLDERATNTERVIRKVTRPKASPPLLPDAPPPPLAPPPSAVVKPTTPLPPFDALGSGG